VGHQNHLELDWGPALPSWGCPARTQLRLQVVGPTKADQLAPSRADAVPAVTAVALVVIAAVAVVGTATAVAGAVVVAVAVAIAIAAVAAGGPQDSVWSYVGAYDRAGTDRF
jgi:hypothetical protein